MSEATEWVGDVRVAIRHLDDGWHIVLQETGREAKLSPRTFATREEAKNAAHHTAKELRVLLTADGYVVT